MTSKQTEPEAWHAIYLRQGKSGAELVCLMRRAVDADIWLAKSNEYFTCLRQVELKPAPITVVDPVNENHLVALLDQIVNGPDESLCGSIEQAKKLLRTIKFPEKAPA